MAVNTPQVEASATVDAGLSERAVWDKQVSAGSTAIPDGNDFSRSASEVATEAYNFDEYEIRGGMANAPSKHLVFAPEQRHGLLTMHFSGQELDFYETRGGMAEKFVTAADSSDADAYEGRGGMAAKLAWQLTSKPQKHWKVPTVFLGGQQLDFFETRGGMADKFTMAAEVPEPDAYEVRGGMAAKLSQQLRRLPGRHAAMNATCSVSQDLDFYEARGGMAKLWSEQAVAIDEYEVRGGMAAKSSWQLVAAPAGRDELPAVCIGGEMLDPYETRGGMAGKFGGDQAPCKLDAYEVRGGMAAALSSHLVKAPEPWQGTPVHVCGEELDFYETRGGMAWKSHVEQTYELDPYETRGGMAAKAPIQVPVTLQQHSEFLETEFSKAGLDFYEVRGGMAGTFREEACEADVYEVRGGMAAKMWSQLINAPEHLMKVDTASVGDMELDFYETRGGLAEYLRKAAQAVGSEPDVFELRGGMATRFAGQLVQLPQHCWVDPGALADSEDVDLYEVRGGMAEHLQKQAGALDVDEYEARGGLLRQFTPMLPVFQMKSGFAGEMANEGDEYEARGGQGAALHACLPLVCQVA